MQGSVFRFDGSQDYVLEKLDTSVEKIANTLADPGERKTD
jgi:hypothetical protein